MHGSQRKTTGYSVAGQRTQSYGDGVSSRRPPAIPVRSQVSASQGLPVQALPAQNLIHGLFSFTDKYHPIRHDGPVDI